MKSLDELSIERYVHDPDMLTFEQRHKIENRLAQDAEARSIAAFYESYYEELANLADYVPPELESFIDRLFVPSTVVPLFPYASGEVGPDKEFTNGQTGTFETVTVLASHTPHALVCIMRNHAHPRAYRLYVLTGDLEQRAYTVVSFPEQGLDVVTNALGIASFEFLHTPDEAAPFATALLRFPIAELRPSIDQLREQNTAPVHTHDLAYLSVEEDTLVLHLTADEAGYEDTISYAACEAEDGESRLWRLDQDTSVLRLGAASQEQAQCIRLYT